MKITSIKQQQKRTDRYSVYVDGKYSFSLNESQLIQSGIHSGQELGKEDLEKFKDDSAFGKLYDKVLNFLSYRMRSEWELRDYLRRKKQAPETIEAILTKLSEQGYVDDAKFARSWVENRRLLKPTSKRRLRAELKQKRISADIIEIVLEEGEADDKEVLRELVERKRKQSKYQDDLKLMQYLSRQGFNYHDIKEVIENRGEQPE